MNTLAPRLGVLAAVVLAFAVLAAPAGAATLVGANGNAFTGGLAFSPAKITVAVGDSVSWKNNDFIAPHTATEDHRLWNLTGVYGQTPLNAAGFAPGTVNTRQFEAGSQTYYCIVHPVQMHGEVDVPVTLGTARVKTLVRVKVKLKKRKGHRRRYRYKRVRRNVTYVTARWAPAALAGGNVMDVERRSGNGAFKPFATGTTAPTGRFKSGKKGTVWEVRARLRKGGTATGWSPVARING